MIPCSRSGGRGIISAASSFPPAIRAASRAHGSGPSNKRASEITLGRSAVRASERCFFIAGAEVLCPACAAALLVASFPRELADAEVAVVAVAGEPRAAACAVWGARLAEDSVEGGQACSLAAWVPEAGLFPVDYS